MLNVFLNIFVDFLFCSLLLLCCCILIDIFEFCIGDIFEFYGLEGIGKIEMFYYLIVCCIFLKLEGGLEVEVLFIDIDYYFDMFRFVIIFEYRFF